MITYNTFLVENNSVMFVIVEDGSIAMISEREEHEDGYVTVIDYCQSRLDINKQFDIEKHFNNNKMFYNYFKESMNENIKYLIQDALQWLGYASDIKLNKDLFKNKFKY